MSARFRINVDHDTLQAHIVAYTIVSEVLRMQSQPILLCGGDKTGLVFELRVNLQQQQCERLIEREINAQLPVYECSTDWADKTLKVTRAHKAKRRQPAQPAVPAAAGRDSDFSEVI